MTVQDACVRAVEFFRQHDSFSTDENLESVLREDETPKRSKQVFELALQRLEKREVVIRENGGNTWFLITPLDALPQNIVVSGETAAKIAEIVNRACQVLDDKASSADPLSITEADILTVCSIVDSAFEHFQVQQTAATPQPQHPLVGFSA